MQSIFDYNNSLLEKKKASFKAFTINSSYVFSGSYPKISSSLLDRIFFKKPDTKWPFIPCPSHTENKNRF